MKVKKLETKNILIDEKNYTNLTIYFARYDHKILKRTLSLYCHESMGNYLIINDYFEKSCDVNFVRYQR